MYLMYCECFMKYRYQVDQVTMPPVLSMLHSDLGPITWLLHSLLSHQGWQKSTYIEKLFKYFKNNKMNLMDVKIISYRFHHKSCEVITKLCSLSDPYRTVSRSRSMSLYLCVGVVSISSVEIQQCLHSHHPLLLWLLLSQSHQVRNS